MKLNLKSKNKETIDREIYQLLPDGWKVFKKPKKRFVFSKWTTTLKK